jgi:hypothetical protein
LLTLEEAAANCIKIYNDLDELVEFYYPLTMNTFIHLFSRKYKGPELIQPTIVRIVERDASQRLHDLENIMH